MENVFRSLDSTCFESSVMYEVLVSIRMAVFFTNLDGMDLSLHMLLQRSSTCSWSLLSSLSSCVPALPEGNMEPKQMKRSITFVSKSGAREFELESRAVWPNVAMMQEQDNSVSPFGGCSDVLVGVCAHSRTSAMS